MLPAALHPPKKGSGGRQLENTDSRQEQVFALTFIINHIEELRHVLQFTRKLTRLADQIIQRHTVEARRQQAARDLQPRHGIRRRRVSGDVECCSAFGDNLKRVCAWLSNDELVPAYEIYASHKSKHVQKSLTELCACFTTEKHAEICNNTFRGRNTATRTKDP